MKKTTFAARAALMVVCLVAAGAGAVNAQSVPAPWSSTDVGSPALAGRATFSNGTFDIDAAGYDITADHDEFHFVYQAITGDIDVRARIDSILAVDRGSKAGIMIRNGLAANAAHAYLYLSASDGAAFRRRRADGERTGHSRSGSRKPPQWARLVRSGTTFSAYTSTDGSEWSLIGRDDVAIGATAYVGIAVNSRNVEARTTTLVSNVSIAVGSTTAPTPLPNGQTAADIGAPSLPGQTSYANGVHTVSAAGSDIWNAADQFHYVYQPVSGDMDVVARLDSLNAAHSWSKAGVMVRETLAADSRHATALVSGSEGYALQWRSEPGAWSSNTSGGAGVAPGWVRLVRKGTLFEAFRSADGANWTSIGTAAIAMNNDVYVGLAVTSHNDSALATAAFSNLRVTAATTPSNRAPTVMVSSPLDGTSFVEAASLTVTASAADADGTVSSVEFYANGALIGRDTIAPYSVPVSSLPQGSYSLTAAATDDQGAVTLSSAVTITVAASSVGTAPTTVAFTASVDHATLVTNYVLEVYASGTTPGSSSPVATSNLGKPTPDSAGGVTVNRSTFFQALASGNYIATVVAVGSGGSSRSQATSFTR